MKNAKKVANEKRLAAKQTEGKDPTLSTISEDAIIVKKEKEESLILL